FFFFFYGNVETRTKVELGSTYATRYTYDNMNQVGSVTYPSGMTVNYQRDQRSRVTDISLSHSSLSGAQPILSGIQYRADDLPVAQTLGNGLQETLTYDLQGRLQTQQLGALFDRTYHYDANGNVLGIDTLNTNLGYGYDALDRINSETGILESLLTYDGNSNRLTQTLTGQTDYDYKVNSNQLVKVGDTDLTLDAAGNTLTDGIRQFSYNDRNQMETYGESGSTVASYEYDVANLRTRKTTSTANHLYHYDLIGRRIQHDINGQNRTATV
ncbi:MAG: RHS repeat protein, partial [Deltaproteobacteria bacterium]|nr:RHS repeat protein [Deltaproteobacteria bacterium]